MNFTKLDIKLFAVLAITSSLVVASVAKAEISFVSASNSVTLEDTIDEGDQRVFVFDNLADGDDSDLVFSTDTDCLGVAMTGGAEFAVPWSCSGGVIAATVTHRGGMSFGPSGGEAPSSFYVTFSNPPPAPGTETPPAELTGTQISVFGNVSQWDIDGEATESGATFGVELSGEQGGEAHFRMYLPQTAADYLGGVLGVFVGGKPYPFATVTTNEDGSVDLAVDIESLKSSSVSSAKLGTKAGTVTKKITTGEREFAISFAKTTVKSGKSVGMALCAGTDFTAGDKIKAKFSVAGKVLDLKKSFTLDDAGCSTASLKLKSAPAGTLKATVSYNGDKAKGTTKVTK